MPTIKDCDLLARVNWIKEAVSSQDLGLNALNSYMIKDGNIYASDGRMVVGTPFPFDGEPVMVPAAEFLRVLANRPEGDFSWETEPDRLILKRGKFRGRIKTIPLDQWLWPTELPEGMVEIPDGLIDSLRALLPFCSENATKPWATTIGIIGHYLYASNNIVVARTRCTTGLEVDEYLLPRWVAEFVIKRSEGLSHWLAGEHRVTFAWEDGSWMRSALIDAQYPPVQKVLDAHFKGDLDVEITPEWRKTILRVGKTSDDPVVRLREDEVRSSNGEVLSVEDDASTPCPEGLEESVWDLRFLEDVIKAATHWNPRNYPNPAPWRGEFIEGIIAARRD
jgi:hypothetical protein